MYVKIRFCNANIRLYYIVSRISWSLWSFLEFISCVLILTMHVVFYFGHLIRTFFNLFELILLRVTLLYLLLIIF